MDEDTRRIMEDVAAQAAEEAVRKMTSLPARRFGLAGRGVLRSGAFADIAVFDAGKILDLAQKIAGDY